jgi:hypothetical protein
MVLWTVKERTERYHKRFTCILFHQSRNSYCKCDAVKYFQQIPDWEHSYFATLPIEILHYIFLICTGKKAYAIDFDTFIEELKISDGMQWLWDRYPSSIVIPTEVKDEEISQYAYKRFEDYVRFLHAKGRYREIHHALGSFFRTRLKPIRDFLQTTGLGTLEIKYRVFVGVDRTQTLLEYTTGERSRYYQSLPFNLNNMSLPRLLRTGNYHSINYKIISRKKKNSPWKIG